MLGSHGLPNAETTYRLKLIRSPSARQVVLNGHPAVRHDGHPCRHWVRVGCECCSREVKLLRRAEAGRDRRHRVACCDPGRRCEIDDKLHIVTLPAERRAEVFPRANRSQCAGDRGYRMLRTLANDVDLQVDGAGHGRAFAPKYNVHLGRRGLADVWITLGTPHRPWRRAVSGAAPCRPSRHLRGCRQTRWRATR